MSIKRRDFLRRAALGTASLPFLGWAQSAWAENGEKEGNLPPLDNHPPYAVKLPTTPFNAPAGSWTLAVLPDTQNYSSRFAEVYNRQCEWIVANKEKHNILFVAHEGDMVNGNIAAEWVNCRNAMSILNTGGVPYCVLPGNHDLGRPGHYCENRWTMLNDYFKEADYKNSTAYSLFEPGKMENSWHEVETPTGKYLILALEHGVRDATVDFARDAVAKHPNHKIIMVTHAYLYCDSTRYGDPDPGQMQKWDPKHNAGLVAAGGVNDGHDLWQKLVSQSPNFQFTLNGHVLNNGTGYLMSKGPAGNPVHQILVNFQAGVQVDDGAGGVPYAEVLKGTPARGRAYGGGGFMRLMQFYPDGKTVATQTYSPWYDRWLNAADQQFVVTVA